MEDNIKPFQPSRYPKPETEIHTCISCGKEWTNPGQGSPKGIQERIEVGYGSRHDLLEITVEICDDCIEKKCNPTIAKWLRNALDKGTWKEVPQPDGSVKYGRVENAITK